MIRGTTPNFCFTIGGETVDLTTANEVRVTFAQGTTAFTLLGDALDVTATAVSCYLTQEQSLALVEGVPLKIQINWTYLDASGIVKRAATKVAAIMPREQLLEVVLA